MFNFLSDSKQCIIQQQEGFDDNNPCDEVIKRLINFGEYLCEKSSYVFVRYKEKVYGIRTCLPLLPPLNSCEFKEYSLFDKASPTRGLWETLWDGPAPSDFAVREFAKWLHASRKKRYAEVLDDEEG